MRPKQPTLATRRRIVGTHWGHYQVSTSGDEITAVEPVDTDSHPSPIGRSLLDSRSPECRVAQPMVRESYLRRDPDHRSRRGLEGFVTVTWEHALDLAAGALERTRREHGNAAIFGGSYGWASAGRFHHAQSQVHRFLNTLGGYTASVNTYSAAAGEVIVPHVLGASLYTVADELVGHDQIGDHCDLMVSFGGHCLHNNQVVPGGVANHKDAACMRHIAARGVEVINIGPLKDDIPDFMPAWWIRPRPGTDVALMLALAHHLETTGRVDRAFIDRYTVGYDVLRAYLLGESDGITKDLAWAEPICGVSLEELRLLAHKLCRSRRPLITIALALQRQEHGEQAFSAAIALTAMLGTIGLKGCGLGLGWGSNGRGSYVSHAPPFFWGALPQGANPIDSYIPVARITEMLEKPGEPYSYDGQTRTYPDIQLIYWAGGNPFHHHQDLNRLRRAWRKPETVIVNESAWTSTARHADIVFPVATMLERNDICCGKDLYVAASRQVLPPFAESRTDYEVFAALSARLNVAEAFTEGRDEMAWLQVIYAVSRDNAAHAGIELPGFEEFWEQESISLEGRVGARELYFEKFRRDPGRHPLGTPSGRIELYSEVLASFGYPDCPGHPAWLEKSECLGAPRSARFPLHLISAQPKNKLHSQFDFGRHSVQDKIRGRDPIVINPVDAAARAVQDGQVVRVFNDRGACLAGVRISDEIMPGVVCLRTGAWFDPDDSPAANGLERHGNPNVLTPDQGTSSLAQGPAAHSCLVEVEAYAGELPAVMVFRPPCISISKPGGEGP